MHPRPIRATVSLVVLTAFAALSIAQSQTSNLPTNSQSTRLVAPFFAEEPTLSSVVTIVNWLPEESVSTLTLLDTNWQQIASRSISLHGQSQVVIPVRDILDEVHSTNSFGSLQIITSPNGLRSPGLVATVGISGFIHNAPVHFEEEFVPQGQGNSRTFAAAMPSVIGSPILLLTSESPSAQTVTVNCLVENRPAQQQSILVPPGELILTPICDSQLQPLKSLAEGWNQPSSMRGATGVSVTTTATPSDIAVYGFAMAGDVPNPTYIGLQFPNRSSIRSSTTLFTGLPVGLTGLLPSNTFHPQLALTNFGVQPAVAKITYAIMEPGGTAAQTPLSVNVPAQSSVHVDFPVSLSGDAEMRNSLIVDASAPVGSVVAGVAAFGESTCGQVAQSGRDAEDLSNGGVQAWDIGNGNESTLVVFNPTGVKQEFNVHIDSGNAGWSGQYRLAPAETKSINIRALVADQITDAHGRILPKDSTAGHVHWRTSSNGQTTARLLVSNATQSVIRTYNPTTLQAPCSLSIDPDPVEINSGTTAQIGFFIDYCDGESPDPLGGVTSLVSSNPTILSVVNNSGVVQGNSVGGTFLTAQLNPGANGDLSGGASVQVYASDQPDRVTATYDCVARIRLAQEQCGG